MSGAAFLADVPARLRAGAESLDRVGVVGIGLLVFGATWYFSSVLPAQEDVALLQARLARAARGQGKAQDPAQRGAGQLQDFYRFFPAVSEAPQWVLKIHAVAREQGLALQTGEYRMTRDKDLGMARYQITLPLTGAYPRVRRFIAQVLDEVPAAVLDEVAMKRDAVGASGVETRVRFTLYLGERP